MRVGGGGAQQVEREAVRVAAERGAVGGERAQVGAVDLEGALQHVARQHVALQRVEHLRPSEHMEASEGRIEAAGAVVAGCRSRLSPWGWPGWRAA